MAVDVQALTTSYGEEVRRIRTKTLRQFHELFVQTLEAQPESRDDILAELRKYRDEYRAAGREDMEDLVLDATDMLTGWCARAYRV